MCVYTLMAMGIATSRNYLTAKEYIGWDQNL